ncbi:MAG: tol-pal system-associated acyl-CoA thioesterase, partial [Cycloclasticus sp.]
MMQQPHEWPVRIYYEDTDMQGIVYYANYLKYLERARTEFLRSKGFEQDELIDDQGVAFAVRAVQMDYLKPAKFNDNLSVVTKIAELKRASLIFHQTIIRDDENREIINKAIIKVACLDAQ